MFVQIQKKSRETRVAMAKWRVRFKALIREQEDDQEYLSLSIGPPLPDAQENYDKLMEMLDEMYKAQTDKIENSLMSFEVAREAYCVWEETTKRTQRVFEAGSRPGTPVFEGKWKGDELFKPSYLSESPCPSDFNEWKDKFQNYSEIPSRGENLSQDMHRAQQVAFASVGPFWEAKLAREKYPKPKDLKELMKQVEDVVMRLYSINKRRHDL